MVSEDAGKIVALIIVTLSYVSIPVLLFLFAVVAYLALYYAVQFYNTQAAQDAAITILLALADVALFFGTRALIKWLRK